MEHILPISTSEDSLQYWLTAVLQKGIWENISSIFELLYIAHLGIVVELFTIISGYVMATAQWISKFEISIYINLEFQGNYIHKNAVRDVSFILLPVWVKWTWDFWQQEHISL